MSIVTTRPSSTTANGDSTVTGAATRHAALNDNSDSSYVTITGSNPMEIAVADPTIPGGSKITALTLRLRTERSTNALLTHPAIRLEIPLTHSVGQQYLTWSNPTTSQFLKAAITVAPTGIVVSVSKVDGTSDIQVYEMYVDTTYSEQPSVSADLPTGTIHTNLPTVEWTGTFPSPGGGGGGGGGGSADTQQDLFEVKVFTSAQYGAGGFSPDTSTPTATSGQVKSSVESWTDSSVLLLNGTLRAYVRVAQLVDGDPFWSDWDETQFTVSVSKPTTPTVNATAESSVGANKVEVPLGGAVGAQVQRSLDGVTWSDVRTIEGDAGLGLGGGYTTTGTVWDYEAPNGATVTYRGRVILIDTMTSLVTVSDWGTDTAMWSSNSAWLKSPFDPDLNFDITLVSLATRKNSARQQVFYVLGRADPIVVSDKRTTDTGDVVFDLPMARQQLLKDILAANGPLFFQAPAGSHFDDTYLFLGDMDNPRSIDKSWAAATRPAFSWIEVASPPGNVIAWPPDAS